jgi:hypothetical protein
MPNRRLNELVKNLREATIEGRILLRKHADERAGKRKVAYSSIIDVILTGEVIEFYSEAKPFPACLFMKHTEKDKPLYVVCSYDGDICYIITVHWLDPDKWNDPWTRREK